MTGGGIVDRIRARLLAHSIDDSLLYGRATERNAVVMVRRARLLSRRYRAQVAAALRSLLGRAHQAGQPDLTARLQVKWREVLGSEPLILSLARELEEEDDVHPRGVILASRLITEGRSPVYLPDPVINPLEETVESAVKHARAALHLG
jgi:hypothetical protein